MNKPTKPEDELRKTIMFVMTTEGTVGEDIDMIVTAAKEYTKSCIEALLSEACNYETYSNGNVGYEDAVPVATIKEKAEEL